MTLDAVFLEPRFPANQHECVRALHAVDARVTGLGERLVPALGYGMSQATRNP